MAKSKSPKPKDANWKKPRNNFLKSCVLMIILVGLLKMALQNPPQKVDVGVLASDVVQGMKNVGNGLVELGRNPMYIESRPITR